MLCRHYLENSFAPVVESEAHFLGTDLVVPKVSVGIEQWWRIFVSWVSVG
jgi:hypothetical protein